MDKLLKLEQELIKAREYLVKQMDAMAGDQMNPASAAGVNSAMKSEDKKPLKGDQHELDMDKDGDIEADDLAALREKKKKMKKAEHPDEKEDKELIAEALDRHNEKKHGEAKDKDSAKKDMGLKKSEETFISFPNGQWDIRNQ